MSRSKPEKNRRPPSNRNREIYHLVRVELRTQESVALQYNISQARISQIVKDMTDRMADILPDEDFAQTFADARRMRLLDWECQQRREEQYRKCDKVFAASQEAWVDATYDGPAEADNLVKTVVKRRPPRFALEAVKEQRRLNNEMQWGGGRPPRHAQSEGVRGSGGEGVRGRPEPLPVPACAQSEAERAAWGQLSPEMQKLATGRLAQFPAMPFGKACLPYGPLYAWYPWRTEAEQNSSHQAQQVVEGTLTIEGYCRTLEHLELSKPFAHPNLLTKDAAGRWQMLQPCQVPLPVVPPEREALPEGSPERIYWPYKSKGEHYAMLRAEMVLRGHLSREQYESLNAWARKYMGGEYPDVLARIGESIRAPEHREGEAPAEPGVPLDEAALLPGGEIANCKVNNANCKVDSSSICNDQFAMANLQFSGAMERTEHQPTHTPALSHGERETVSSEVVVVGDASPAGTAGRTRIERRLASGRRMPEREARRLAGRAERARESAGNAAVDSG